MTKERLDEIAASCCRLVKDPVAMTYANQCAELVNALHHALLALYQCGEAAGYTGADETIPKILALAKRNGVPLR